MGDGNFKWYVGRGAEPEVYQSTEDSREAAIQVGKDEYHSDGDGFTICEADKAVVGAIFDEDRVAEIIIEDIEESNHDCWGEDGPVDVWPAKSFGALGICLRRAVTDWLKEYPPKVWSFDVQRNEEYFPAPITARVSIELDTLYRFARSAGDRAAILTRDPNAIALELTTADGAFADEEDIDRDEMLAAIKEWQAQRREAGNA